MKLKKYLYLKCHIAKLCFLRKILGFDHLLNELSNSPAEFTKILLERYGAKIGNKVKFKGKLLLDNADKNLSNLNIGNKCYIGKDVFFDLPNKIILNDECLVGPGTKFITHFDCGDRIMSKWYSRISEEINIGYGSFIGVNATILSGVKLGKYCVVAAGAVVTESFPDHSVIAGVPAKIVKKLEG